MTKHQHHSKRKQVRNACLQCRNAHAACCEKRPCERWYERIVRSVFSCSQDELTHFLVVPFSRFRSPCPLSLSLRQFVTLTHLSTALGLAHECVDVPRRQRVNKSKLKIEGEALRLDAFFLERKRSARIAGLKRELDDSCCDHEEGESCGCSYLSQRRNSYDSDASSATQHEAGFFSEEEECEHDHCDCPARECKRPKIERHSSTSTAPLASGIPALTGARLAQHVQSQQKSSAFTVSPGASPSSSTSTSPASDALSSDFHGYDDFEFFSLEDYGGACCCGTMPSSCDDINPMQWNLEETIFGQYQ
jgi:hypothetical protein